MTKISPRTWIAMTVAYMSGFREEDAVNATAILNSLNNGGKLLAFVLGAAAARFWGYRSALLASFLTGLVGLCIMPFTSKVEIRRNPGGGKEYGDGHFSGSLWHRHDCRPGLHGKDS